MPRGPNEVQPVRGPRHDPVVDDAIRKEVDFRHRVRLNRMQQEGIREKIRAKAIVARLQAFVLGRQHGKREVVMSDAQVRAAFGLLAKCVPDLHRVEHKGLLNNPLAPTAGVVVLATQSPAEAARAYLAMVNADDSFEPDPNAIPGEFSGIDSTGDAPLPVRLEEPGL